MKYFQYQPYLFAWYTINNLRCSWPICMITLYMLQALPYNRRFVEDEILSFFTITSGSKPDSSASDICICTPQSRKKNELSHILTCSPTDTLTDCVYEAVFFFLTRTLFFKVFFTEKGVEIPARNILFNRSDLWMFPGFIKLITPT